MRSSIVKMFIFAVAVVPLFFSVSSVAQVSKQKSYYGRAYTIVFPTNKPGSRKYPLVLALHGGLGNAAHMENVLPFNRMAKRYGYIMVYPNGNPLRISRRRKVWNAGGCCGRAMFDNIDDVGYLSGLIESLVKRYPINRRKIYMLGYSNGAMMAYRFACERPGVLAGIIPVSGPLMSEGCDAGRIKVLHIHGADDQRVPVEGRRRIRPLIQSRRVRSVRVTRRILERAGARVKVKIVQNAGHSIREIDGALRDEHGFGIPEVVSRLVTDGGRARPVVRRKYSKPKSGSPKSSGKGDLNLKR